MNCKKCQKELRPGVKRCPYCGAINDADTADHSGGRQSSPAEPTRNKSGNAAVAVMSVIIAVAVVVCAVWLIVRKDKAETETTTTTTTFYESQPQPSSSADTTATSANTAAADATIVQQGKLEVGSAKNFSWTYHLIDEELTISGTGDMSTWSEDQNYPWLKYAATTKSIILEEGITAIGPSAFADFEFIEEVSLPSTVKSVESGAFARCISLKSIEIPSSVEVIDLKAFDFCKSISEFNVASGNKNYVSISGVLFNKEKTELLKYPQGKEDEEYTIPSRIAYIGKYAFTDCTQLKTITVPVKIISIGTDAFSGCTSLTSVNYKGTQEQWEENLGSGISSGNELFKSADINYES